MFLNSLVLIFHTITFVGNTILMHSTLTAKRSKAAASLIWGANWIFVLTGYVIFFKFGITDWSYYYLLSVSTAFLNLVIFRETFAQDVFLFTMLWGFASFLSALCNWVAYWLRAGELSIVIKCLLYMSFYVTLIPLYRKYWRRRIKETLALFRKGTSIYVAFPVLAFIVFAALFGPMAETTTIRRFLIMVAFELLIVLMYYLLFSHFQLIFQHLRAEDRLENSERQLLLQKKYYEEVDKGVSKQAKLLHDTRHHLLAVASLARTGNAADIEAYIEQLLDIYGASQIRRYCEHDVANAIIGAYIDMAVRNGIAVSTEIDLPRGIGIDVYDLCTLFGNTIENAIEACQRIPPNSPLYAKRYISVASRMEKGRLVVRIENSYEGELVQDEDSFASSKGARGGIGLRSVKMVVDAYTGCISCTAQNSVFILSALVCPGLQSVAKVS